MRDKYATRLYPGARVADLREGKTQEGRALGPAGGGRIRVEWDDADEEDVLESDLVAAGAMFGGRRRR